MKEEIEKVDVEEKEINMPEKLGNVKPEDVLGDLDKDSDGQINKGLDALNDFVVQVALLLEQDDDPQESQDKLDEKKKEH